MSASDVIRQVETSSAAGAGKSISTCSRCRILRFDDRVTRTQYQYTLEDPDTDELNEWTDKFTEQLQKLPELEDVATDQQTGARAVQLSIDRVTASRLGVAPDHDRQHALRRLWTAADQHAVYAAKPVSCGAGDRAPVATESGKSPRPLYPVKRLVGRDRSGSGHLVLLIGLGIGGIECSNNLGSLYAVLTGGHRPIHSVGGRCGRGKRQHQNHVVVGRQCHPAQRIHTDAPDDRSTLGQPSRTVPVGDGIVQSGAARFSWNGNQPY